MKTDKEKIFVRKIRKNRRNRRQGPGRFGKQQGPSRGLGAALEGRGLLFDNWKGGRETLRWPLPEVTR